MQTDQIGIILLIGLLATSLILTGIPFTTSQFIEQTTDANYILFEQGYYDKLCVTIDGNKLSFQDCLNTIIDLNIIGTQGQIPFLTPDGNTLEVGGLKFNKDTNTLNTNCIELGDGNTYCSSNDFPNPDLSDYVPYSGATTNVDLGANNLTSNNFITNYVTENINIKDSFGALTSGVNNIGIGTLVFPALTTGSNNIGVGKNLAPLMTTGSNNIFIGTASYPRVTNPTDNVVIGIEALGYQYNKSQANRSVIIGKNASRGGTSNRQVNDSVVIGSNAGVGVGGGNKSVFIGAEAGKNHGSTTGYSVGIGYQSMGKNWSYSSNYGTAIGANSLYSITTGNGNVASGYMAGSNITTTEYNTFIGTSAGRYLGTGTTPLTSATNGVFLGYNTRGSANSQTNEIVIGSNAVGKGSNTAVIGNTSTTGLYLPADNYKLFLGTSDDASIYYDGTNLVINPKEVGSGLVYVDGNVSAEGFVTRTSVYDKSKGSALDKIKDADELVNVDKTIMHESFFGYTPIQVTDYSRPVIVTKNVESCFFDEKDKEFCEIEKVSTTTYPYKRIEGGVDLGMEIDVLRQAVFELKTELCKKDSSYEWCKVIK